MNNENWTYEKFWNVVFDGATPKQVVIEYELIQEGLEQWINECCIQDWKLGKFGTIEEMNDNWKSFQERAASELSNVLEISKNI